LWFELGSGPGWVRTPCGSCTDVTVANGSIGYLRVGGTISHKVFLGVETFGFTDETFGFAANDTSIVANNATLAPVVLWYPWRGGVFLKGGVGLATGTFTVTPDSSPVLETTGIGVGLTLGVGFDLPISRRFALTANAAAYITAIGDITISGYFVDDVIAEVYQVNLGFTVR
jgi:hypothetical protein